MHIKFKDVQIVISTPIAYYQNNYSFGVGRTFELMWTRFGLQILLKMIRLGRFTIMVGLNYNHESTGSYQLRTFVVLDFTLK